MIDLDYNDENNDYILDMFYGIEDEEFYIGIKYKDGSISKYPFTIHNYNAIIARLERQYNEYLKFFEKYKKIRIITITLDISIDLLWFDIIKDFLSIIKDDRVTYNSFLIFSGFIILLSSLKTYKRYHLFFKTKTKILERYLKNKEIFLIELPNGDFTYGLNIANINGNTKEIPYNEEIKGQMKLLKYIAEKENSRDGLNG